jgi:riboflavin biosynthesis pyrimidine reductase
VPSTRPPVLGDDPGSLDALWEALAPDPAGPSPTIRAVMITSLDGSSTVDGRSAGLGTPADHLLFHAMRARSDLVLVGAATALSEGYGPAVIHDAWKDRRPGPPPPVALLARSVSDDLIDHCAGHGEALRVVVTQHADPARVDLARDRGVHVDVLDPGPVGPAARAYAARLGAHEVDFEGGPRLLGAFFAGGAVDELVLTLSPQVILGGDDTRLVLPDAEAPARVPMHVATAFTAPDGGLYTRWVMDRSAR